MKKVFKKAIITIMMASFISVQISGTQVFARGNGHNHDHGHEHVHEENEYEDLENTTTDITIDETENVEDITNNDVVAEDELLEEESTEGEVPTEDNEELTGEDNENPESELTEVEIDESEEEPDNEGSEEIEEEIIDNENDTDTFEDEEVENENVSDSDIITLHPSVEEQLANLSQEQIDSYMEFAAKREPFYLQYPDDDKYLWILRDDGTLSYQNNPAEVYGEYNQANDILYAQNVTDEYSWMYKQFYVKDDYEIHRMNNDGTNDEIIYTSSTKINEIKGCEEYLFYLSEGAVYRLHIATGVEEYVTDVGAGYNIMPYDSYTITWTVLENYYVADSEEEDSLYRPISKYCYDIEVGLTSGLPEDYDRIFNEEENYGIALLSVTSESEYNINEYLGEYIPGAYFSNSGEPCTDHNKIKDYDDEPEPYGNFCDPDIPCSCKKYDGGIQCAGYASYCYAMYHGHVKSYGKKISYYRIPDIEMWASIEPWTYVRIVATDNQNKNIGHSFFVVGNTGSQLVYYECNYDKRCGIRLIAIDYAEINDTYEYMGYIYLEDDGHTCTYKYRSNKDSHWLECSTCVLRKDVTSHTESGWYVNGNYHSKKCTVCGYVTQSVPHTQGTTYSTDGTNHWLSCTTCGMKMTNGAHNSSKVTNNGNGTHSYSCSVCGRVMSTASHTYGNYVSDGSNHWKVCTVSGCGAITGKAAHTSGSLVNNGSTHSKSCTTCGYVTLLANHSYTSSYSKYNSSQHKATCACGAYQYVAHTLSVSSVGSSSHTQICSKCGYSVSGSHSYTTVKNNTSTHKKVCSVCNYSYLQSHTYTAYGQSSTQHFYRCSVCGQTKSENHSFTSTVTKVSTASTCTKTVKKCSCGYSTTVTDTSHRFTGIKCLDCNYTRG